MTQQSASSDLTLAGHGIRYNGKAFPKVSVIVKMQKEVATKPIEVEDILVVMVLRLVDMVVREVIKLTLYYSGSF